MNDNDNNNDLPLGEEFDTGDQEVDCPLDPPEPDESNDTEEEGE